MPCHRKYDRDDKGNCEDCGMPKDLHCGPISLIPTAVTTTRKILGNANYEGRTDKDNGDECRRILNIIDETGFVQRSSAGADPQYGVGLSKDDLVFLDDMREKARRQGDKMLASRRQLNWLRDIKDKSV